MRAIIKIDSSANWIVENDLNFSSIKLRNIHFLENNIAFLKQHEFDELIIINEILFSLDFMNYINSLKKWGIRIKVYNSYGQFAIESYKSKGMDVYNPSFDLLIEGIHFFDCSSDLNDIKKNKVSSLFCFFNLNFSILEVESIIDLSEERDQIGVSTILETGANIIDSRIGHQSWIENECSVSRSYIGDRVLVQRNTTIKNCIILDDVIVGGNLALENSLIFKDYIYKFNNDGFNKIKDCNLVRPKMVLDQNPLVDKLLVLFLFPLAIFGSFFSIFSRYFNSSIYILNLRDSVDVITNKKRLLGLSYNDISTLDLKNNVKPSVISYPKLMATTKQSYQYHLRYCLTMRSTLKTHSYLMHVLRKGLVYKWNGKRVN